MSTQRQQVLMLWLANSSLDSPVLGWSFYDGAGGAGPTMPDGQPYATGVDALLDGWRLLQMAQLLPAASGEEHSTSYLKHEMVFERLVEV